MWGSAQFRNCACGWVFEAGTLKAAWSGGTDLGNLCTQMATETLGWMRSPGGFWGGKEPSSRWLKDKFLIPKSEVEARGMKTTWLLLGR